MFVKYAEIMFALDCPSLSSFSNSLVPRFPVQESLSFCVKQSPVASLKYTLTHECILAHTSKHECLVLPVKCCPEKN